MKITNTVKLARRAKDFVMELVHWRTLVLMKKTRKENLADSDLIQPDDSEKSHNLGIELQNLWKAELIQQKIRGRKPSLHRVVYKMFWRSYIISGMMLAAVALLRLSQPIFITKLLEYVSVNSEAPTEEINKMIGILVAVLCLRFGLFNYYLYYTNIVGLRVRIACSYLIFVKMLEEDVNSKRQIHPVNLLSNDVARLEIAIPQIQWLWVGPLFLVATSIITYVFYDYVVLLCVVVVYLVCGVIVFGLGKLSSKLRTTIAACTDKRLRLMTELIGGIQIIKLYAWEEAFQQIIEKARRKEVRNTMFANVVKGVSESFYLVIDRVQYVLILLCSVIMGQKLLTYEIFGTLLILLLAKAVVTRNMPIALSLKLEYNRSLDRIQSFLFSDKEKVNKKTVVKQLERGCVVLNEMSASWDGGSETLHGINISLHPGAFCAVVGPVGSGKTSLLHVLMSELRPSKGVMELGGSVSYAAQEPWTFHGTVRENILFGQELEQTRYDEVIRVCALKTDLEQLSHGDGTLVGERGVKLSGGQRARISLARAVYKQADVYIFDDPLSAVDAHVSKYLFHECFSTFLKNKTRILVTHQIQYLPLVDHIVVFDKGSVQVQGTFKKIVDDGYNIGMIADVHDEENADDTLESEETSGVSTKEDIPVTRSQFYTLKDVWNYLKMGSGICGFAFYLLVTAATFISFAVVSYLVGVWSNVTDSLSVREKYDYLMIILYGTVWMMFLTMLRSVVFCFVLLRSASRLHGWMVTAVLNTGIRFFHCTPAGTILAHFSEDVGTLDEQLPRTVEWLAMTLTYLILNVAIVAVVNYYTLVSSVLLYVGSAFFIRFTAMAMRHSKDAEREKRGTYFSHVTDSVNGVVTIRALSKTEHILNYFNKLQDKFSASRLLTLEMNATQTFFVNSGALASLICNTVLFMKTGNISEPSTLGFGFLYTLFTEDIINMCVEFLSNAVSQFPSVANCFNITKLEPEQQICSVEDQGTRKDWPSTSKVEFRDVTLRYCANGPAVLNGISFTVDPGERIGVVGRTGAGKSSLMSALLRLAILDNKGAVLVDFVDTRQVPLKVLRRTITVIPQDPVMFSGTVRYNLDPFNEMDDASLWNALNHVELSEHVESLDAAVEERGRNWSVGQRQLLCLARASLRNSRILVLDEATASIDHETDKLIQRAIRHLFTGCTIITIAHRLNTIMDSDRILVMDAGNLVEFDSPLNLLKNEDSFFYKLAKDTGDEIFNQLKEVSRKGSAEYISPESMVTKL